MYIRLRGSDLPYELSKPRRVTRSYITHDTIRVKDRYDWTVPRQSKGFLRGPREWHVLGYELLDDNLQVLTEGVFIGRPNGFFIQGDDTITLQDFHLTMKF
jgi:hypothetical protein